MTYFFDLPLEVRLALIFVAGLMIGTQVNRGIYRLAWFARPIGPWLPREQRATPRYWFDFVPVVGWFGLAREATIHGRGYWVRPLLLELLMGAGFAALYWWEVAKFGLTPALVEMPFESPAHLPLQSLAAVHAQFFAHVLLITLMTMASFIDIDEKLIPDTITLPGTLLGLLVATLLPISQLPVPMPSASGLWEVLPLRIPAPHEWSWWLDEEKGLAIGLLCFAGWWLALLDLRWLGRNGVAKAWVYLFVQLGRRIRPRTIRPREGSPFVLVLLAGGLMFVAGVWFTQELIGVERWRALLSALVGMVFGGGLVWAVRIIGTAALRQEAMGFGDVTLVAMIGAFLGWQPCLMLFFIAPFAGMVIAVIQLIAVRRHDIWYGPFLCLGALVTIVCWAWLWQHYGQPVFWLGWIVPGMLASCLVLMGGMLWVWRLIKEAVFLREDRSA